MDHRAQFSSDEPSDEEIDEEKVTPVGRGPKGEIIVADGTRVWACLNCGQWETDQQWPPDLDTADQGDLCSFCSRDGE